MNRDASPSPCTFGCLIFEEEGTGSNRTVTLFFPFFTSLFTFLL